METWTLKPAPGISVRKPGGALLAADGESLPKNSYWLRRFNDGDVAVIKPKTKRKED